MDSYTQTEAARRTGVTRQAVLAAVRRGELPDTPIPEAVLRAWATRASRETVRVTRRRIARCRWCGGDFSPDVRDSCPNCI